MKKALLLFSALVISLGIICLNGTITAEEAESILVIPEGTTEIPDQAYLNRTDITGVEIPGTVVSIGKEAFSGCTSLVSVTLPDSVETIGYKAFHKCKSLKEIIIPDSVTKIGSDAFASCVSLTSVHLPDSVESLGMETFSWCTGLVSVHLPEHITVIPDTCFNACENLTEVNIPDSVTRIESWAFTGCHSLENITIPSGVTYVGNGAFGGTAFDRDKELFFPESLDKAEKLSEGREHLLKGKKIIPRTSSNDLNGTLFNLLPEDSRTCDTREAEYAIIIRYRKSPRNDYTGKANDMFTEAYLTGRDGSVRQICSIYRQPPKSGMVAKGGSLDGKRATEEEIWEKIQDLF